MKLISNSPWVEFPCEVLCTTCLAVFEVVFEDCYRLPIMVHTISAYFPSCQEGEIVATNLFQARQLDNVFVWKLKKYLHQRKR